MRTWRPWPRRGCCSAKTAVYRLPTMPLPLRCACRVPAVRQPRPLLIDGRLRPTADIHDADPGSSKAVTGPVETPGVDSEPGPSKRDRFLDELPEIDSQLGDQGLGSRFIGNVSLLARIRREIVQLIEFGVLHPMDELMSMGADRAVIGVEYPRHRSIVTVVLD